MDCIFSNSDIILKNFKTLYKISIYDCIASNENREIDTNQTK